MVQSWCGDWPQSCNEYAYLCLQVCGARGPGSSAAQSMFLEVRQGQAYMLGLPSAQERNICIAVIRAKAERHGLYITGPSH